MQKHLRSKIHLENDKQNEMIVPEWLFKEEQTPIEKKIKKSVQPQNSQTNNTRKILKQMIKC